jgi:arginyl-tRNA synthetase
MSATPTISQVLTDLVIAAAEAAGHAGVLENIEPAVPTNNPAFGDYQSNHAFRLGKALRTNPRAVAEAVKAALPAHPAVAKAEVAGPGFLNFTLDTAWLAQHLTAQVADPMGGVTQSGAGRTVVIDYSSPNVAKRMHVGHMRSTIIGNTLDRLHRAQGWTVVADNHIGDWGTQYGKLMVAWRRWLDKDAYGADPIAELERLYVKFNQEAGEGDDDEARAETAKLQAGDPENRALWSQFITVSLAEFDKVYARMGVAFDETLGESAYNEMLPGVVADLKAEGIAMDSDGAVIIKWPEDAADKALADKVLVIQKQDGAFLYGTTDLATLEYRMDRWSPDRVVYVTDMRQQLHFRQVFTSWREWRAARQAPVPTLVHTWFGLLKLPEGNMSTRKGNVIRLVDLLDEATRRARVVVDEKSGELPEAERAAIAEAVGVGAIRYADLSQNPQSSVTFEWDRILSLEGNTAPYLMYSCARGKSVLRKAEEAVDMSALALEHELERALAIALSRVPEVVAAAVGSSRANLLCEHLFETANAFNRFYHGLSVLKADTPARRASRLALVTAATEVLGRGMALLGIKALERM